MTKSRTTLIRYHAVVAAVYFVAFLLVAGAGTTGNLLRLLWLPFAAAAFSVFITSAAMARFGNAGGSVYFTPTFLHVMLFIFLAFALFSSFK